MVTRVARRRWKAAAVLTVPAVFAVLAAPVVFAEPEMPAEPQPPLAVPVEAVPADAPLAAAAPEGIPAVVPVEGVPHLPSPDSPPPGTTTEPTEGRTLGYLRDLWHAVQTQDVTMSDALLLFAQRPMSSNTPLDHMSPQPQVLPGAPVAEAAPAPVAEAAPAGATPGPVSAVAPVIEPVPAPPPIP